MKDTVRDRVRAPLFSAVQSRSPARATTLIDLLHFKL